MNNLAKYRAKHGMTQTQLGNLAGVTKSSVSFTEKGKLNAKVAVKYAEILGENVFAIMGLDSFKVKPTTPEDKAALLAIIEAL